MRGSRGVFVGFLAACVLTISACSDTEGATDSATRSASTATDTASIEDETRSTLFGVAGLIPPNFPNPTQEDWDALFSSFTQTGTVVGVYQNWNDGPGTEGQVPEAIRVIYKVAEDQAIVPVIGLGVKTRSAGDGLDSTVDYADPIERQQVIDTLVGLVGEFDVEYLIFGAEINRLPLFNPDAFESFVDLYAEAYDAVKVASPDTTMFTVFQLELMRGDAYLMGDSENRGPQWDLVSRFDGRLDLLAFTVYPGLDFIDPADIPDDYFSSIVDQFGLALAFTEVGWPSEPIEVAGVEAYGGTNEEQVAFVERFGVLIEGLDVRLALWAIPNDVGSFETPAFESVAIRANDGTPKPALAAWQILAGIS